MKKAVTSKGRAKKSLKPLQYLIVVRHGRYGLDDNLDKVGKDQMGAIGKILQETLNGSKILLLSSTAPRAMQSAGILARSLGIVSFECHDAIWSDNNHEEDCVRLFELVKSKIGSCSAIVLVTHLEYAEDFPEYFAKNYLKVEELSGIPMDIEKGEAIVIDCQNKSFTKIVP